MADPQIGTRATGGWLRNLCADANTPRAAPRRPWFWVGADLFEQGGRHYLLMVCYYSRYPEVITLLSTSSLAVTAVRSIFARFSILTVVVLDNEPQFALEGLCLLRFCLWLPPCNQQPRHKDGRRKSSHYVSKAFDAISHSAILDMLRLSGIEGRPLSCGTDRVAEIVWHKFEQLGASAAPDKSGAAFPKVAFYQPFFFTWPWQPCHHGPSHDFLLSQLKLLKKKPKGRRYNDNDKNFEFGIALLFSSSLWFPLEDILFANCKVPT